MKVRGELLRFVQAMETKLAKNDHKGGWGDCSLQYLSMRLTQEKKELIAAVQKGDDKQAILYEAADVANFAMMIAAKWGALPELEEANDSASHQQINEAISLLRYLFYMRLGTGQKISDICQEEYALRIHTFIKDILKTPTNQHEEILTDMDFKMASIVKSILKVQGKLVGHLDNPQIKEAFDDIEVVVSKLRQV